MKNTVIKSVFVLALACSGASCTGNYLEINSNPYEVTEEDFALCEFVDPSKIEIQQIIRDGINLMIREA